MLLGMSLPTFTLVHVVISLIGIASGSIVVWGMLAGKRKPSPLTAMGKPFGSQEAGPASLPEFTHVMPSAFACWASP